MYYYTISIEKKVPGDVLTYSCPKALSIGQVVTVPLRKQIVWGIVLQEASYVQGSFEVKSIEQVYSIVLNTSTVEFLSHFAYNTFNALSSVTASMISSLKQLLPIDWKQIVSQNLNIQNKDTTTKTTVAPKPLFYVDLDHSLRIKYIIRSLLSPTEKPQFTKQILLLCAEKNIMRKLYSELSKSEELTIGTNISLHAFISDASKSSRLTTRALLADTAELQIIISTRNGLFLPFRNLSHIIMLDEGSPFYIQEQNGLYYDTRDAVFFLGQAFLSQIIFISTLPSIRLHNFYSEALLDNTISNDSNNVINTPKIKIREQNRRDLAFGVFSAQILDDIGIVSVNE